MKRLVQIIVVVFVLLLLYPIHAMRDSRHCREFSQTMRATAYWACGAVGWIMYGSALIALIVWGITNDWDTVRSVLRTCIIIYVMGAAVHFNLGNPRPRNNPIR